MKPKHLILALLLNLSALASFAQSRNGVAGRLMHHDTALILFKRPEPQKFIVAAAIDKHGRTLYILDRDGVARDSLDMSPGDYDNVVLRGFSPFKYYTMAMQYYIDQRHEVIRQLRKYGKPDPASPLYEPALQYHPELKDADSATVIQSIVKMEREDMREFIRMWVMNTVYPSRIGDNEIYPHGDTEKPGSKIIKGDSVLFTNNDELSVVHYALLDKKNSVMLFKTRDSAVVGRMEINPKRISKFTAKDAFDIYSEVIEEDVQSIDKIITALQAKNKPGVQYASLEQQNNKYLQKALDKQRSMYYTKALLIHPDFKLLATSLRNAYSRAAINTEWLSFLGIIDGITPASWDSVGNKRYELTNHLGNVMAVISDKRIVDSINHSYRPDIQSAQDFYAFGAIMPGRSFNADGNYPFGFNGKRYDNEVMGIGNWQDYGMRMYDPRVGRFPSVDPITKNYPELTPYQFSSNSPIHLVDINGLEGGIPIDYTPEDLHKAKLATLDFLGAAYMTIVNTLGAISEIPGQIHYGDRIRKEDQAAIFPLTHGQNFKTLAVGTISGPIVTIAKVINYPNDPKAWGELAGTAILFKAVFSESGDLKTEVEVPFKMESIRARPSGMSDMEWGNALHYDQFNGGTGVGLPTQLALKYPNTIFEFTGRGASGADVKYVSGEHPSQYPGSTWDPANDYGDFKTINDTKFNREIKTGKLPTNTQKLTYDPKTGKLE